MSDSPSRILPHNDSADSGESDAPLDNDGRMARILPHSDELEQALLGALLIDPEFLSEIGAKLRPSDFYRQVHRDIYRFMVEAWDQSITPDYVTIYDRAKACRASGEPISDITLEFLMELTERAPISANALHYAGQIRQKAVVRDVIACGDAMYQEGFRFSGDLPDWLDSLEKRFHEATSRDISKEIATPRAILREVFDRLDAAADDPNLGRGIPSGLDDLDALTGGLHPEEMMIIAARPSTGKTTVALTIFRHLALRERIPCAFFSCETSREQLMKNILSAEGDINSVCFRKNRFSESDYESIKRIAPKIAEAPLYIDDTPNISLRELRSKARRMVDKVGVKVIFIDYLQLMGKPPGLNKTANREQEIAAISRGIKALARELKIPIVVLAQLNRDLEKGTTHRKPRSSDLRESGSIEQDADVIALLHREYMYTRNEEDLPSAHLILSKQRNGGTGEINLRFRPQFMRFENWDDALMGPVPDLRQIADSAEPKYTPPHYSEPREPLPVPDDPDDDPYTPQF